MGGWKTGKDPIESREDWSLMVVSILLFVTYQMNPIFGNIHGKVSWTIIFGDLLFQKDFGEMPRSGIRRKACILYTCILSMD